MKKTFLYILLFLLHMQLLSQTWPKYYGKPNINVFSKDFAEIYDKGFLICGGYGDLAWLIKTNINGDTLWSKILVNSDFNYLTGICPTKDGGLLACGALNFSNTGDMPHVIKFDACGEKVWCRSFTGSVNEMPWAEDVVESENGEIIVLVNMFDNNPELTLHLFKLDADGNLLWQNPYCSGYQYTGAAQPLGYNLLITSKNKAIITGTVYWEDPWNPGGAKGIRPLFISVDSIGNEEWVLPFGLQDTIYGIALDVKETLNSKLLGAGFYWPTQGFAEGLVIGIDSSGSVLKYNIINAKQVDTTYNKLIFGRILIKDSLYVLGGLIGVIQEDYPMMEVIADKNIFSPEVNFPYFRVYEDFTEPYELKMSHDNKILSKASTKNSGDWQITLSKLNLKLEFDTAYTGNYTYDSLCSHPIQSGFINLDDCQLVDIKEIPSPQQYYARIKTIPIIAYPNPATDKVHFKLENTEHNKNIILKCFNLLGKEMYQTPIIPGQREASTDVTGWNAGMYLVVVYSEGRPVGKTKVVVRK